MLDAPVSGGDIAAREGRLTVMVGGDDAVRLALAECWKVLASNVVACGPAGNGQHTKLVNQIAIASGMIGVCEAMLYAHQAGLDLEKTLAAISPGAAGSWSLSNLAPRIVNGNFSPGFMVEHFVKDMGLAASGVSTHATIPSRSRTCPFFVRITPAGGSWSTRHSVARAAASKDFAESLAET